MTVTHALVTFVAAAGLLTMTPGVDTALVLRTAMVRGGRRALAASVGICLGCLTWGFAVSIGLGALLSASQLSYDGLRIAGAGYLIVLRINVWRHGSRLAPTAAEGDSEVGGRTACYESPSAWLVRGFLTNVLNPKVGVFYISFMPMFVPPGVNVSSFSMLLALIHALESLVWFAVLVVGTQSVSSWLGTPRVVTTINRASGTVFIIVGTRLLFDRER